jgi:hypothetical protein
MVSFNDTESFFMVNRAQDRLEAEATRLLGGTTGVALVAPWFNRRFKEVG